MQDITETSKATENLRFLANNDPLTKVYNRRGIERMFNAAHARLNQDLPLALAYLDLDRFKLINDMFGHAAGDEVLKQVCDRITGLLARGQSLGRVGGDEFVLIMPDTNIALASLVARGIVSNIGDVPFRVNEKAFHVRGSIGLVEVTVNMNMQEAISTADRACREAKKKHTDGVIVYEKDSAAFAERREELQMIEELSSDAATHRLFLEMQPIMSLKRPYESRNVEVLLRMRDHDGKTIPAGPVITAAEKSGRTGLIDRWVLSTTLAWIETNLSELVNMQFICINLNGASLNDEHFLEDAVDLLIRYPDAAKRICLEVTESVALHYLENTRRFIDNVRGYGAKVGLDDFGAGYTSFSYLKELMIGMYCQGNQPDQQAAYYYDYAGQPWKTQELIRKILALMYGSDKYGLAYPGMDDQGATSSWYVLSAMGFYPVDPSSPDYIIGSPIFDEVTLHMGNGKDLIIQAKNNSEKNLYIQSATLNGKAWNKPWFSHADIASGGKFIFNMGPQPNPDWGSAPNSAPPSMSR